jgi:hypothetical protein
MSQLGTNRDDPVVPFGATGTLERRQAWDAEIDAPR